MTVAKRTFLAILIVLSLCVIWLATSPLITPRIPFNHRRAIERINDLNLAEHNYTVRYPGSGYACSLGDLGKQGLVDERLGAGTLSGYHFEIRCPQTRDQRSIGYAITALPVEPGHTGTYAFCTDQSSKAERFGTVKTGWHPIVSRCASQSPARSSIIERKYRDAVQ